MSSYAPENLMTIIMKVIEKINSKKIRISDNFSKLTLPCQNLVRNFYAQFIFTLMCNAISVYLLFSHTRENIKC